jgi:hypothetical protein
MEIASKTSVEKVEILFVEGKRRHGVPGRFPSFALANAALARCASDAPKGGAYDKCDVKVTFEDDFSYTCRIDLHHASERQETSTGSLVDLIERHVREHLEFSSGQRKPAHMTQEQYEQITADAGSREDCAIILGLYDWS